jgi:hypothetical protein
MKGAARWIALGLLLVPLLLLAIGVGRDGRGVAPFPGLEPDAVHRVEMARGRHQVVLARRADTGRWAVLSAADAPAHEDRIARLLDALHDMRGTPADRAGPGEALEIRLSAADGSVLGHAAIRPGAVTPLPEGSPLAVADLPAFPLWQSAWADVAAPRIPPAEIVAVRRLAFAAALTAARRLVATLSARGLVAAGGVNWAGATTLQLTMADGGLVDIQQVRTGPGTWLVRLNADTRPDIRAARIYAFRTSIDLGTG